MEVIFINLIIYERGNNNNELAQGNKATIFLADFQGRYLLNTSNNLSLFGGLTFRSFSPETVTATLKMKKRSGFLSELKQIYLIGI